MSKIEKALLLLLFCVFFTTCDLLNRIAVLRQIVQTLKLSSNADFFCPQELLLAKDDPIQPESDDG